MLIQAWLDKGDEHSTPDLTGIPFIAASPIFVWSQANNRSCAWRIQERPCRRPRKACFGSTCSVPAQSQGPEHSNQLRARLPLSVKLFSVRPTCATTRPTRTEMQWRARIDPSKRPVLEVYATPTLLRDFRTRSTARGPARPTHPGLRLKGTLDVVMPGGRDRFELPNLKSPPRAAP